MEQEGEVYRFFQVDRRLKNAVGHLHTKGGDVNCVFVCARTTGLVSCTRFVRVSSTRPLSDACSLPLKAQR